YFKLRGLAQPIRLLLKYTGTPFTDKYYDVDSDLISFRDEWYTEKFTLGLDFPNVPYYIDANVKLTQSIAILRYLGRKHGLVARDETGLVRQDLSEQQLVDYRSEFVEIRDKFNDIEESTKDKFITETLPHWLDQLSKFLGSHQWFVGQTLTYVDFLGYETLDRFRLLSAETLKKYHNLVQYLDRFENLPQIKAYMKSNEFISWPLFGPHAHWGKFILKGIEWQHRYKDLDVESHTAYRALNNMVALLIQFRSVCLSDFRWYSPNRFADKLRHKRSDVSVAVITGADDDVGKETAISLAKLGVKVIMGVNSVEEGHKIIDELKTEDQEMVFDVTL
ncbi:unnamed protein product, partial [Oppiella nova]